MTHTEARRSCQTLGSLAINSGGSVKNREDVANRWQRLSLMEQLPLGSPGSLRPQEGEQAGEAVHRRQECLGK